MWAYVSLCDTVSNATNNGYGNFVSSILWRPHWTSMCAHVRRMHWHRGALNTYIRWTRPAIWQPLISDLWCMFAELRSNIYNMGQAAYFAPYYMCLHTQITGQNKWMAERECMCGGGQHVPCRAHSARTQMNAHTTIQFIKLFVMCFCFHFHFFFFVTTFPFLLSLFLSLYFAISLSLSRSLPFIKVEIFP